MKRSFKAFLAAVLIAVPVLASCNEASNPVSPVSTIERQDGLLDLVGGLVGGVLKLVGGILTGPDANGSEAYAWITSEGGTVKTAAYTLTVPRGAVSTKTKFVVKPTNTGAYMLELDAYQQGLLGLVNVGAKGFKKPVLLTISYAKATGVTDAKSIVIVYVTTSVDGVIQSTTVDTRNKTVTSPLSHFSKYAMVQN